MDWNIFWAGFWQIVIATPMLTVCIFMLGASLAIVKALGWGPKVTVKAEKPTAGVYFASPFTMDQYWTFQGTVDAYNYLNRKIEAETGVAGQYEFNTQNLMTAPDGTTRIEWARISEVAAK